MSNNPRRKLLKSIAVGSSVFVTGKSLPNSWKRPVVDSVILPAHAQTSVPCSAPPGCFDFNGDAFYWPGGGQGPFNVAVYFAAAACGPSGTPDTTLDVVIAANSLEASSLFGGGPVVALVTTPPAPAGCTFFERF
jgi:hypothetical protein